jgi:hypothetical protein
MIISVILDLSSVGCLYPFLYIQGDEITSKLIESVIS